MEQYLKAYKKECNSETKIGNAESKDADAITIDLYKQVLVWATEDGNVMVLFWTQTMCFY